MLLSREITMPSLMDWWNRIRRDFRLAMLPHRAGTYRLQDRTGLVIYIGYADDLTVRLADHFSAGETNDSIRLNVADFQFQAAASEEEAKSLCQQWLDDHARQNGGVPVCNAGPAAGPAAPPPGAPQNSPA